MQIYFTKVGSQVTRNKASLKILLKIVIRTIRLVLCQIDSIKIIGITRQANLINKWSVIGEIGLRFITC